MKNSSQLLRNDLRVDDNAATMLLTQESFVRTLYLEKRRTERSGWGFILMLLEPGALLKSVGGARVFERLLHVLAQSMRETDTKGWYKGQSVVGVLFTEISPGQAGLAVETLQTKITTALATVLSVDQINQINLSFHAFPEEAGGSDNGHFRDSIAEVHSIRKGSSKTFSRVVKRSMDIIGSSSALILLFPLFVIIAIMIKLTSDGPILFRQRRVGQYGRPFLFLKFRSMYFASDQTVHEQYVKKLITGDANNEQPSGQRNGVYKLTADPRITPVGRFLRRTSLDELPQFVNVLMGDMSLVGPRPPITYEVEAYDTWHKRRLSSVKPGITGLWQVHGRSRVKFDDMVRLDLKYARSWSLWLDIKILLLTPRAVLLGEGAY